MACVCDGCPKNYGIGGRNQKEVLCSALSPTKPSLRDIPITCALKRSADETCYSLKRLLVDARRVVRASQHSPSALACQLRKFSRAVQRYYRATEPEAFVIYNSTFLDMWRRASMCIVQEAMTLSAANNFWAIPFVAWLEVVRKNTELSNDQMQAGLDFCRALLNESQ